MNILVTGASGLLGRTLVRVIATNHQVFPVIRPFDYGLRSLFEMMREREIELVVHCAAAGLDWQNADPDDVISFNISGAVSVIQAAAEWPARVIHVSTGMVYRDQMRPLREDDPLESPHLYGASKAAADLLVRPLAAKLGVALTVVRPFPFTGVGDRARRLWPSLVAAAKSGQPLEITTGEQFWEFNDVLDIADAIKFFAETDWRGQQVFNIGSGIARPVRAWVRDAIDKLGMKVEVICGGRRIPEHDARFLVADTRNLSGTGWRPSHSLYTALERMMKA